MTSKNAPSIADLLYVAVAASGVSAAAICIDHPGPSVERFAMWLNQTLVPDHAWDHYIADVCSLPVEEVQAARLRSTSKAQFGRNVTLAEIVHSVMTREQVSEAALAERIGVSEAQLVRWHRAETVPGPQLADAIAAGLDVAPDVIRECLIWSTGSVDVLDVLRCELTDAHIEIVRLTALLPDG